MSLTKQDIASLIEQHQTKAGDTGSPEVQIALLSKKIENLTEHLKLHKQDNHSQMGLLRMVNQRRRLLDYLKKSDIDRYRKLLDQLGLRH